MSDEPKIDRTTTTTWPALVARAKSYLAGPAPIDSTEWAKHFAAGIVAMDNQLTLIVGAANGLYPEGG